MDIQTHFVDAVPQGLSYDNIDYWQNDSGYHTSYTPGSLECSEISGENLNPSFFNGKIGFTGQFYTTLKYSTTHLRTGENYQETPQNRRGIKRGFQEASENSDIGYTSIQTPTSVISGGLHKLRFNEANKVSSRYSSVSLGHRDYSTQATDFCNENIIASFPTTPIKKSCRTNCLINSPFKLRPVRNLDFEIHSICCDKQALQPVLKTSLTNSGDKKNKFKPNKELDIITMLFQNGNYLPPISKIFSYLSNEDIDKFISVSPMWQNIWKKVDKEKQEYINYLKTIRENQENKMSTPKNYKSNLIRPLMEIQNVLNNHNHISSPISPPRTPGTNRFTTYTKAASMDSRKQLSCVRCQYPAKITEETTGEEWVECTSSTCAYQYCRLCKCERHPGKSCIKYDLDGPSPSKRKKNICAIGTKKSKRNLRRLL